ncbi:hypothetical protein [Oceanithermus sp.]
MSVFFPIALFYAVLLALALWGALLGWTRSKSPTARYFVTIMALVWAGATAADAWRSYQLFSSTGLAEIVGGEIGQPVIGGYEYCSLCYEGPAGSVYVVAAGGKMKNGEYLFGEPAHYSVRFESGVVLLDGRRLEPGCYVGDARAGTRVLVQEARKFRLEVGEAASCK